MGTAELTTFVARVAEYGGGSSGSVEVLWVGQDAAFVKVTVDQTPSPEQAVNLGVSLLTLNWLGVENNTRRKLVRQFIADERGATNPSDIAFAALAPSNRSLLDPSIYENVETELLKDIESEDFKFSFLDIGTGEVGLTLSTRFENATVLSIMDAGPAATAMTANIVAEERWNHAICTKETIEETSQNLYESPELMRYAYWDAMELLLGGKHRDMEHFGSVAGSLFTSSLTNFVKIPTAKRMR